MAKRNETKNFAPYVDPNSILNGRMYLGSFDDSVSRHPWLHSRATADSLMRHLLLQSMLGPPVCFRIGNLLYHPPYFKALLKNELPILELARSGFVQIHTKGRTINDTLRLRKRQGTNSTEKWIADNDWFRGSDSYQKITKLDRQLKPGVGKRQYSPSFHKAFGHFAKLAGNENDQSFKRIYDIWVRQGVDGNLTRSDFEKICEREKLSKLEMREAMSIINSVNHYAYGVGLCSIEKLPLIDTNELISLRRYTTGFGGDDGRDVEFDVIDELLKRKIFRVIADGLKISEAMLYPGAHWSRYAELLHLDNLAPNAVAFRALKVSLVHGIRQCVNGTNLDTQRQLMKENCELLSEVIRHQIGFPSQKENSIVVDLAVRAGKYFTKKAAFAAISGGVTGSVGAGALEGVAKTGVDICVSMVEDGTNWVIERIQDSVSVEDPGDHFRDLLPAVRSALSWRYIDQAACKKDGII
jgi:hypothetical protein